MPTLHSGRRFPSLERERRDERHSGRARAKQNIALFAAARRMRRGGYLTLAAALNERYVNDRHEDDRPAGASCCREKAV
jgi:hypothetical protein